MLVLANGATSPHQAGSHQGRAFIADKDGILAALSGQYGFADPHPRCRIEHCDNSPLAKKEARSDAGSEAGRANDAPGASCKGREARTLRKSSIALLRHCGNFSGSVVIFLEEHQLSLPVFQHVGPFVLADLAGLLSPTGG